MRKECWTRGFKGLRIEFIFNDIVYASKLSDWFDSLYSYKIIESDYPLSWASGTASSFEWLFPKLLPLYYRQEFYKSLWYLRNWRKGCCGSMFSKVDENLRNCVGWVYYDADWWKGSLESFGDSSAVSMFELFEYILSILGTFTPSSHFSSKRPFFSSLPVASLGQGDNF